VRELPRCKPRSGFFKIFTKIVLYGVIEVGDNEYHIRFERNLKLRGIKPDKGGLSGIKGQNDGIKVGNGSEVKGKRAEGTWAGPEAR
jgi:hypothetical protein